MNDECRKELKPCPFCGGEAMIEIGEPHTHEIATFMPDSAGYVMISCSKCSCATMFDGQDVDNAIAAWNSRTESKRVTREDVTVVDIVSILSGYSVSLVRRDWNTERLKRWHKKARAIHDLFQLSAPQSPVVPTFSKPVPLEFVATEEHGPEQSSPVVPGVERQLPEVDEMVAILQDTLDALHRRTRYEYSDSLGDQLNEGAWDRLKMALETAKKVKELIFLMEDNLLATIPQRAPVVPGVEES